MRPTARAGSARKFNGRPGRAAVSDEPSSRRHDALADELERAFVPASPVGDGKGHGPPQISAAANRLYGLGLMRRSVDGCSSMSVTAEEGGGGKGGLWRGLTWDLVVHRSLFVISPLHRL